MTIKEIINDICESAVKNNLCTVAMGGLSLYEVNFQQNNQYPLLFVTPSQNYTIKNNIITYNIYLYYIDRLLRNNDNNIDIVSYSSTKLQSLVNLIKKFDDVLSVNTDYQVYNFADTQRLTDNVGGSYMTLSLTVKNDLASCTDSDIEGIIINKDDLQIITYTVTENGEYLITPDSRYKGIAEVNLTVDVPNVGDCQEEIENAYNEGYNNGSTDGYGIGYNDGNIDGINTGIQQQKDKLTSITINNNGTYTNEDGYNKVIVEVPQEVVENSKEFDITDNGTYTVTPSDGYTVLKEVNINVNIDYTEELNISYTNGYNTGKEAGIEQGIAEQKALIQSITITENGVYSTENGYSPIDVSIDTDSYYNNGYAEGFSKGETEGYNEGYDVGIEQGKEQQKSKLTSITITDNGTYSNEDGYSEVTVNVNVPDMPNIVDEFIITDNGTYTGTDYNGDAVKDIIVELPLEAIREESYNKGISEQKSKLTSITIENNGTYSNENGYDNVIVDVDYTEELNISYTNGYNTGKEDGISEQKSKLTSITITDNGTYSNEDGYSEVTVNVSGGGGSAVPRIPNGIYLANSTFEEFDFAQNDWSGVVDFSEMFHECTKLKYIHNFPATDEYVSLKSCFYQCPIESIEFPPLKVVNLYHTFDGCYSLTSLDLSNWDVSKCMNMESLFQSCRNLTTLNLTGWYFPYITNLQIFKGLSELTEIEGLETWDTSNVTNMSNLFYQCSSLTSLDLSNWNLENVTNMESMFDITTEPNLSEIKMGGRINSNVNVSRMFNGLYKKSNGKFYYPAEYADDYVKIIETLPSTWQAISY